MLSGAFDDIYRDADFVIQLTEAFGTPESFPTTVANRFCCLAYDEFGMINNGYDLTFACEEIQVDEITPIYDPETETCDLEIESYVYVDLDANQMYDMTIDGEQFAYSFTTEPDFLGDQCCQKAADEQDLATAEAICDLCTYDEEKDEFYTYDAPVCTRRFDRVVSCYLSTHIDEDDTVLVDETHCIEETLEASDCCEAKTQGKNGIGLEDACAEIFFVPTEDDSMESVEEPAAMESVEESAAMESVEEPAASEFEM